MTMVNRSRKRSSQAPFEYSAIATSEGDQRRRQSVMPAHFLSIWHSFSSSFLNHTMAITENESRSDPCHVAKRGNYVRRARPVDDVGNETCLAFFVVVSFSMGPTRLFLPFLFRPRGCRTGRCALLQLPLGPRGARLTASLPFRLVRAGA